MSFKIDFEFTIDLIGHFSIDGDSEYHDDLSQLKYYISPSNPNYVNFDLNKNNESTKHKSTSHIKLDHILKWISHNFRTLEKPLSVQEERWLDFDFICARGLIKTILSTPYINNENHEWIICASKYRGTIYLCKFHSDKEEQKYLMASDYEKQVTSRGFKFEQYMLADHPSHIPNPEQPLNECEEFNCMFKAKFDTYSLLYGAEIDGISSQHSIRDTLVDKRFELIELKTYPMYDKNMYGKVPCERVSMWWSQSYLVKTNKIIFGLKDRNNKVRKINEYSICDLPYLSKKNYCTKTSKLFCKIFLDNVKRIVIKDHNECMYKFQWELTDKDVVKYTEESPNNERFFFLKPWFITEAEDYRKSKQISKSNK
ncbi:Protein Dom3Z [Trachymyrmex septentrionalis]|uniref:Decapping nuclease n=1 Tax=Trachymyrmex septentrionalis TaxID=34720 RepID=A0A195F475_9HYME|nr:PREDICTED: decapping and exoribonuclease protein-like [Trachymyrmex septentrionalis]KYN35186.1 Protein Dom3Z [Trachymyrmex septentrionalis]